MLTKESFNAFLKTLEEPPSHTIFIFATTDVHKVPLTIISRCQRFDFRRIDLETIKSLLSKIAESEGIEIDDKTLTLISRKADGALRDAESYFDQVVAFCGNKIDAPTVSKILNLIDDEIYFMISDAVLGKNYKSVFEATKIVYENGWNFTDFIDGLIEHFRNIMTVVITENTQSIESAEIFKKRYLDYIDKFSEGDILRLLNYLNKTGQELRYSQNQKLKIEIALCHLVGLEKTTTISGLIQNLNDGNIDLPALKSMPEKKSPLSNPGKEQPYNYKEPVPVPPLHHKSAGNLKPIPVSEGSLADKWREFAELVSEEKRLTLGHLFSTIQPVDISGNKISLEFNNQEEVDSVTYNMDYLTKKATQFFGRKLHFNLVNSGENRVIRKENSAKTKTNSAKPQSDEDKYIELIINELGGEELG